MFLSFGYCGLRPMLGSDFRELVSSYVIIHPSLRSTLQIFIFVVKTVTIFYVETLEQPMPAKQLNLDSQNFTFFFLFVDSWFRSLLLILTEFAQKDDVSQGHVLRMDCSQNYYVVCTSEYSCVSKVKLLL
jgi:hypothetical protein